MLYYQDGRVTIYHANCHEMAGSIEADALVTDPPYGINCGGVLTSRYRRANGKNQLSLKKCYKADTWDKRTDQVGIDLYRGICKHQIIWGGQYYSLPSPGKWLVWDKKSRNYFADAELAWTNLKGATRIKEHRWSGCLRENREPRFDHPTQKPLDVMKWCCSFLKLDSETVIVDPYMGSGTTLRAAKDLGCRAIGIEVNERYCELATNRLRQEVLF